MAIRFDNIIREFERTKKKLPVVIGNMAKNHFKNNFREQGFVDEDVNKWQSRKSKLRSDKRNPNRARAILVNTGHLRNSINVGVASFEKIEIGTYGITYGVYHNKGTEYLPVRKFMGTSHKLSRNISDRIQKEVREILGRKEP